jgi:hypothetical protein
MLDFGALTHRVQAAEDRYFALPKFSESGKWRQKRVSSGLTKEKS